MALWKSFWPMATADDLVLLHTDDGAGCIRGSFQHCLDSFGALEGRKHAVVGTRCASTLDVSESGDSCVKVGFVGEDILDLL
jgi:hypothetical protein